MSFGKWTGVRGAEARFDFDVMPAKRGIQQYVAPMMKTLNSRNTGRPVKPGDDDYPTSKRRAEARRFDRTVADGAGARAERASTRA
jgi:hypothetical protein